MKVDHRATKEARKRHARGRGRLNKLFGVDGVERTPLWSRRARRQSGSWHRPNLLRRRRRRPRLAAAVRRRDALTRRALIKSAHARGYGDAPPAPSPVVSDAAIARTEGITQREVRLRRQEELRARLVERALAGRKAQVRRLQTLRRRLAGSR